MFIDGIDDVVTYHQLRNEFRRFGTVVGVYLLSRRKPGRRTRFAFVRYEHEQDVMAAVRRMDGAWAMQSVLRVNAKYETRSMPKKVWQAKKDGNEESEMGVATKTGRSARDEGGGASNTTGGAGTGCDS